MRVLKVAEKTVQAASHEVNQPSKSSAKQAGMATTMPLLMIVDKEQHGSRRRLTHVSEARWEMHQLFVDHTLAIEMNLSRWIPKVGAAKSRDPHLLTRIISRRAFVTVDSLFFAMLPSDRLLLGSDDLSLYFSWWRHQK